MKKASILLIFILATFYLFDRATYLFLLKLDSSVFSGQDVGKTNLFFKEKDSVNVIVFGSSRASHHFNNNLLNISSFNMGMDGRKIDFVDALVSTLNRQGQIILVHVDPDEIITKSQGVSNSARVLANYYLRDQSLRSYFNKYQFLDASIIRFAHTYSYNGKALGILKNYFFPQTKLLKNKGYEPLFPTETQKEILTKQYSALNLDTLPNSDITLRETSINYEEHLTNILEKCARNRARLIFFSSPTLVPYNGPSVKGYFDNRQLEYYDYSNYFNYYQPEDWKDLSHLSSIGAEKFSTKLIEEIVLSEEIKY